MRRRTNIVTRIAIALIGFVMAHVASAIANDTQWSINGAPNLNERGWLTAKKRYKGLPIVLRRPEIREDEIEGLQARFPMLLVVSHKFEEVSDGGLPTRASHGATAELDEAVLKPFKGEQAGIVGVAELFAAKRTYYIYVTRELDIEPMKAEIARRFSRYNLKWELEDDAKWRVFWGYARDFGFYRKS